MNKALKEAATYSIGNFSKEISLLFSYTHALSKLSCLIVQKCMAGKWSEDIHASQSEVFNTLQHFFLLFLLYVVLHSLFSALTVMYKIIHSFQYVTSQEICCNSKNCAVMLIRCCKKNNLSSLCINEKKTHTNFFFVNKLFRCEYLSMYSTGNQGTKFGSENSHDTSILKYSNQ